MDRIELCLNSDERAVFALRSLYKNYGYTQYRMSKFEEYDLYAKNKNFLVSDNVITFTDTDGKLMALKPDVTLSIIKNDKEEGGVKKLYYNEHVYRVSKGTKSFKEIMQVGLECLGDIDDYSVTEVLYLAAKSLDYLSDQNVLDLSHIGLVNAIIEYAGVSNDGADEIIKFVSEKNLEGVKIVCQKENISEEKSELIQKLVTVYGNVEKVLPLLSDFAVNKKAKDAVECVKGTVNSLKVLGVGEKIRIDFSVVNDVKYYNGFVFKGFVSGIPTGILSGGQYDNLMAKMGKKERAIGFAVYLDDIERLYEQDSEYDVDVAIEYGDTDMKTVSKLVEKVVSGGKSVLAERKIPQTIRYREIIKL